ncbi:polysaccharide lyase family 8 super-sandwich domain-containing protein [Paenibacillus radicis (ex Xue et al. 2023)]|uniref:Cadherin-like beta sandwich domain-containing protein n=1 Tax=Paenibacillus radicis (ex Xue et al. 2023) TaxID=2972489 RepID=A0ABT1YTI2_9BACL|nr:polysaccharide lyase family 8 super-sandwich domain-containing protein [Paenibacillus radicis (ex Xue et al. 2023)]MCR8636489.1 cadherin-like beta sandwich domain-containing protein [Paenibacillus radicis (ex Xue et al. 2023)]
MHRKHYSLICLALSMTLLFSLFVPFLPAPAVYADGGAPDEFDQLRLKWKSYLLGGNYSAQDPDVIKNLEKINAAAKEALETMIPASPTRKYLWVDLDDAGLTGQNVSSPMTLSYGRLESMALAYSSLGVPLYQDSTLRSAILDGLDWLYANKYKETIAQTGNWYDWEIGTPLTLNNSIVLMYSELSATQLTNYARAIEKRAPDPTQFYGGSTATGANLMWKSMVVAIRGIAVKDSAKIAASRDAINPLFDYVTTGDGFYTDGSFIQHTAHPYNGGYGTSLVDTLVPFLYELSGSTWEVKSPKVSNLYKWMYDSFEPFIYKGALMNMIRGREMSRRNKQDHKAGHVMMNPMIQLAQFAPEPHASRLKSMIKYWIQADTFSSYYEGTPTYFLVLGKQIANDPQVAPRGEYTANMQFPNMDRTVHLRPGFGFGIAMSSSRIYRYESINGENLKGWYTGDGMTHLYTDDLGQYSDEYWGTVDKKRLPGTTTDVRTRTDASGQSTSTGQSWVGGTSVGSTFGGAEAADLYGLSGMQLAAWSSTLKAKKSWFMFDDEIVALGSAINSTDNRTIETTIDNRKIKDSADNKLTVNGTVKPGDLGWNETMSSVSTISLEGNVPGSDVGYYFPMPTAVSGLREARTDQWVQSNSYAKFIDTEDVTKNFVTLTMNHGSNPIDASYQYVILPNKTSDEVTRYAQNPDIKVLENSPDAQAVQEIKTGAAGANFWNDKSYAVKLDGVDFISSNKKASVMVLESNNQLEVAVSDPTQLNTGTINVEINRSAFRTISADNGVTVMQTSPTIKLAVNVSGSKGKTFKTKLALTDDGTPILSTVTIGGTFANFSSDRTTLSVSMPPGSSLTQSIGFISNVANFKINGTPLLNGDSYSFTLPPGTNAAIPVPIIVTGADGRETNYMLQVDFPQTSLLNDNFNTAAIGSKPVDWVFSADYSGSNGALSSSVQMPSVGTSKVIKMVDTINTSSVTPNSVTISKSITPQSGIIIVKAKFMQDANIEYANLGLADTAGNPIVTFMTMTGKLGYKNGAANVASTTSYSPKTWYTVKLVADTTTGLAQIYVNDVLLTTPGGIPFRTSSAYVGAFTASTGASGAGTMYIDDVEGPLKLDETFTTQTAGSSPTGWNVAGSGGSIKVQAIPSAADPSMLVDAASAAGGMTAVKTFTPQSNIVIEKFKMMLPAKSDNAGVALNGPAGAVARIYTNSGNISYQKLDGTYAPLVTNYNANQWYAITVVSDTNKGTSDFYIDDVLGAAEIAFLSASSSIQSVSVAAGSGGKMYMDNVTIISLINDQAGLSTLQVGGASSVITLPTLSANVTLPYGAPLNQPIAFTTTGASVKINGNALNSGDSLMFTPISRSQWQPVTVAVYAESGRIQKYTLKTSVLSALPSLSIGGRAATVSDAAYSATVSLPYGSSLTQAITYVTNGQTVKFNGVPLSSGNTYTFSSLSPTQMQPVSVSVYASNGYYETYTLNTRVALSNEKVLSQFAFTKPNSTGTINEAAKTVNLTVPYGTDVTQLTASFQITGSGLKANGQLQASGVTVNNFTNPVIYTVIAADGSEANYTVTVVVTPASTDSTLNNLTLNSGSLPLSFSPDVKEYNVSVDHGFESIQLTPTANSPLYRIIKVNEQEMPSGIPVVKPLIVGENVFKISITAEDGLAETVYTVIITRAPKPVTPPETSNDSRLGKLMIGSADLSPGFASDVTNYTARVRFNVSSITLLPTAASLNYKKMTLNDQVISSGSSNTLNLAIGDNLFTIAVTAEDGNSVTLYKLVVTRDHASGSSSKSSSNQAAIDTGNPAPVPTVNSPDVRQETKPETNRPSAVTFEDIRTYSWAREAIESLASKGIIEGTAAQKFSPEAQVTRADALLLIVRALGLKASFDSNFGDVSKSDYYYNAIGIAKQLGVVEGTGVQNFNPKEEISRQDFMVICARALKLVGKENTDANNKALDSFADKADIAPYAAESIAFMVHAGIVEGEGPHLNPHNSASRAEAAVLLYRILNMNPKN